MKKYLLIPLLTFLFFFKSYAQLRYGLWVISDTLITPDSSNYFPDTSAVPLWQLGHSYKPFFNVDSTGNDHLITDTLTPYPANANNYFVMKIYVGSAINPIIDIWHKYQTDSIHSGGIVEYSLDAGITWQNIVGDCWATYSPGILTNNFYSFSDTIFDGEPAFTGTSDNMVFSQLQFFQGFPVRSTVGSGCSFSFLDSIFLRFRFVSDSTIDSLAGWMIDSVRLELDYYGSGVAKLSKQQLNVTPNPSYSGYFHFPAINDQQLCTLAVYNTLEMEVYKNPYTELLDLSRQPPGMYFYTVTDGQIIYKGKLIKE